MGDFQKLGIRLEINHVQAIIIVFFFSILILRFAYDQFDDELNSDELW